MDTVPGATILLPEAEVVRSNAVGRQVMGQGSPDAAVAGLVEDGVDHLASAVACGASSRFGFGYIGFNEPPLAVSKVCWVRRPAHKNTLRNRAFWTSSEFSREGSD